MTIREIKIFEEKNRGKGIGTNAISCLLRAFQNFKLHSFSALIEKDNVASIKAFEKNGFMTDMNAVFNMYRYTFFTN